MKVLYYIALLLIGWSSARTEKLDESRLMAFCGERNVAYVKAKVAKFGEKGKIQSWIQGHEGYANNKRRPISAITISGKSISAGPISATAS